MFMAEPQIPRPLRLNSWKEIADHLDGDVGIAMQWAESRGLPVRRPPGVKSGPVFAFAEELDRWLAGQGLDERQTPPRPEARKRRAALLRSRSKWIPLGIGGAVIAGLAAVSALVKGADTPIDPRSLQVTVNNAAVSVIGPDKQAYVIYRFDPALSTVLVQRSNGAQLVADTDGDQEPEVLVGIAFQQALADRSTRSGALLNLATTGEVRWQFAFDDTVRFGGQTYRSPWKIADWQLSPGPGPRNVAVAAHHSTSWPSIVALLDNHGRPVGSFFNAGAIDGVRWLGFDRIAIAGFSSAKNSGLLAVLDARHPSGHSPVAGDRAYACESCPDGRPLAYITFPRSELNKATNTRVHRALVEIVWPRLVATTGELGSGEADATAIYEFDLDLNFVRARYSDRYWDAHRRLEAEGRLDHTPENCPERDGPAAVQMWTRERGWLPATPAGR